VALLGFAAFTLTAHGFSAREEPTAIERWMAGQARYAALPAEARNAKNPVANSPEVLEQARAHWADHCAACHANDGSGDTPLGKHSYPPAPDMRQAYTQQMTDGELFYIIENGIRLSGMPAWGTGSAHDAEDSWKLVYFIRHLPQVTADEKRAMEKLNPKSPDDLREEKEEEDFLNGTASSNPTETKGTDPHAHHHH
jgi:mono/diheme cytochrome c family protein